MTPVITNLIEDDRKTRVTILSFLYFFSRCFSESEAKNGHRREIEID
jgi:hypothetical protein